MPELDTGQLRTAYRALSAGGAPSRPSMQELQARIDARRRKSRRRLAAAIGASALILIAVAVGLSRGHDQRVSTVDTGPGRSTASFSAAARSIQRANAAPLSASTNPVETIAKQRRQVLSLLPTATPGVQSALRVHVTVLDHDLTGGGHGTGQPTKAQIDAANRTVDQALRRDCGLSLSIFGYSVKPTSTQSTITADTSPPSQTKQGMCRLLKLNDAEQYVGLSVAAAEALANDHHARFRILNQDGHANPVTSDRVSGRIDVSVTSGRVAAACSE